MCHNCYQCHSKEKSKGDLVLQTKDGVMAGGENGPILVAGNADQSEMIRRLLLPRSDEESMPPKGKTLQKDEIELIPSLDQSGCTGQIRN
ncbi:MAG: c-type cytochrome domain-containing protein [Bacteroidia bacterium]